MLIFFLLQEIENFVDKTALVIKIIQLYRLIS